MVFPDEQTILALHKKYAPHKHAFQVVYEHCQVIAEIANEITKQNHLPLNKQLVRTSALLHDIGYYPLFDDSGWIPKKLGITHGIAGAEILRKEGIDEAICRFAERHTGVGLTQESILKQGLPLPPRDYVAETPEEWLIMYADKLHTKSIALDEPHDTRGWFVSPETYLQKAREFGEDNANRFARLVKQYGTPDLQTLAHKYNQEVR